MSAIKKKTLCFQSVFFCRQAVFDSLNHSHTAVDVNRLAGNVLGFIRCQESNNVGDILCFAEFAFGNLSQQCGFNIVRQNIRHRCADKARSNRVDGNAAGTYFRLRLRRKQYR